MLLKDGQMDCTRTDLASIVPNIFCLVKLFRHRTRRQAADDTSPVSRLQAELPDNSREGPASLPLTAQTPENPARARTRSDTAAPHGTVRSTPEYAHRYKHSVLLPSPGHPWGSRPPPRPSPATKCR